MEVYLGYLPKKDYETIYIFGLLIKLNIEFLCRSVIMKPRFITNLRILKIM